MKLITFDSTQCLYHEIVLMPEFQAPSLRRSLQDLPGLVLVDHQRPLIPNITLEGYTVPFWAKNYRYLNDQVDLQWPTQPMVA